MSIDVVNEIRSLWQKVLWLEKRLTVAGGWVDFDGSSSTFLRGDRTFGTPPGVSDGDKGDIAVSGGGATWTINNDVVTNAKLANMAQSTAKMRAAGAGTGDPIDGTPDQLSTMLDGATDPFVRTSAAGGGDVSGPGTGTNNAVPRWSGTGGDTLEDTGVTIDDDDIITANGLHIPLFDAGNSGTSKTLDWTDGNEQLLTLTGNVTLTLSNPRDGGRYVVLLATGAGGFSVAWPANVLWPAGTAPTITTDPDRWDLITLIYLSGAGVYLGSFNQNYDDDAS